jgi:hypothetical protein
MSCPHPPRSIGAYFILFHSHYIIYVFTFPFMFTYLIMCLYYITLVRFSATYSALSPGNSLSMLTHQRIVIGFGGFLWITYTLVSRTEHQKSIDFRSIVTFCGSLRIFLRITSIFSFSIYPRVREPHFRVFQRVTHFVIFRAFSRASRLTAHFHAPLARPHTTTSPSLESA